MHTPGPWTATVVTALAHQPTIVRAADGSGDLWDIATVNDWTDVGTHAPNQKAANAALIAAAPTLLAACQAVLDEFPAADGRRIESVKAICRAAIAASKGA